MASEHALPEESQTQRSSPSPPTPSSTKGASPLPTSTTARRCSPARQGLRRSPWRQCPASTRALLLRFYSRHLGPQEPPRLAEGPPLCPLTRREAEARGGWVTGSHSHLFQSLSC